jgi:hypothetical protein
MRLSIVASLGLFACAPRFVLPPITAGPEWDRRNEVPLITLPAVPPDAASVRHDYDAASGYSRYSVTTHRGTYTLWIEKPQITFFALTPGHTPGAHPGPDRAGLPNPRNPRPSPVTCSC